MLTKEGIIRFVSHLFLCFNAVVALLLVLLFTLSMKGDIDYMKTSAIISIMAQVVGPGFALQLFIFMWQDDTVPTRIKNYAILNVILSVVLFIIAILLHIALSSESSIYLENIKKQEVAMVEPLTTDSMVQLAKQTYHQWLRLQQYRVESGDIARMLRLYGENAKRTIRLVGMNNIPDVEVNRDQFKENALMYYYNNVPNRTTSFTQEELSSWRVPRNLYEAERKKFFGSESDDNSELFDAFPGQGIVRVRGVYIISAPPEYDAAGQNVSSIAHDDIFVEMEIAVYPDRTTKITRETWEYSINLPEFPTDPMKILQGLSNYQKRRNDAH